MSEVKHIREWLQELPDGYRELAIAQYDGLEIHCERAYAVVNFICWANTKEGPIFWNDVNLAWRGLGEYPPLPTE